MGRLVTVHITIVRLEGVDAQAVRGQSGTIAAVVHALLKAWERDAEGEGALIPRSYLFPLKPLRINA